MTAVIAFTVAFAGMVGLDIAFRGRTVQRPASEVSNGSIAFSGSDGTTWQIFSVEANGSGLEQLTHVSDSEVAEDPTWSPDGTLIAYAVVENGGNGPPNIWVMNADGSGPQQLTDGPGSSSNPAWSPDGTRIAFARGDPTQLYVLDANGGNATQLTSGSSASDPAWSPDGSRIAFAPSGEGEKHLYVVNADGTAERQLFDLPGYQIEPAWSPDGRTIAFTSWDPQSAASKDGIFAIDADGTDLRLLSDRPASQSPSWSPDGRQIVFMADRPGSDHTALFVMNADGSDVRELPGLPMEATFPSWQSAPAEPSATAAPSPPPDTTPHASDVVPIQGLPGAVSAVTYGLGSVWVASYDGSMDGKVTRLDADTGDKLAEVSTGDVFPTWEVGGGDLAVGDGSVWMAGASRAPGEPSGVRAFLLRIDPTTN